MIDPLERHANGQLVHGELVEVGFRSFDQGPEELDAVRAGSDPAVVRDRKLTSSRLVEGSVASATP